MVIKVVHCKKEHYDVYIGRGSKWGNPYSTHLSNEDEFKVSNKDEAIVMYEAWINEQPELMSSLYELEGKILGCWCAPKACHGDVIKKLVEKLIDSK
jgi:hypothetical protein